MRTITIHPLSLALGLVFGGLCLLSMSQVTVSTPLRVEYIPHPKDMVQIHAGTPYLVPAGRIFTLTGLGGASVNTSAIYSLSVNGVQQAGTLLWGGQGAEFRSVVPVAAGFTVPAGSTIDVGGASDACAWGYLVNQ